jgi:hypothetical protein
MISGRKMRISLAMASTRSAMFVARNWSHTCATTHGRRHGGWGFWSASKTGSTSAPIYMFKVIAPTRLGAEDGVEPSPADADVWAVVVRSAASISASTVDLHDCIASSVIRQNLRLRRVAERVQSANLPDTSKCLPKRNAILVAGSELAIR